MANITVEKEDGSIKSKSYKCLRTRSLFEATDGIFRISETRLQFFIIRNGNAINRYAYIDMQIKDVTSICANYLKQLNIIALIVGLLISAAGILTKTFLQLTGSIPIILIIIGALFFIGSFTFLRIKTYKINIGTPQGGVTLIGSTSPITSSVALNNPMTVVYNAVPFDSVLIQFVEDINRDIEFLQQFGSFPSQED